MIRFPHETATYEPTADDRLWLARALEAEGPPRREVAEALVNGFGYARSRGRAGTLASWVRAYAQPVNPRWFPQGDLFVAQVAKAPDPTAATSLLKRAEDRERVHATRLVFGPDTKAAVQHALSTAVTHDVTDYAAATLDASTKGYLPRSPATPGLNRLWTRAPGWPGYTAIARGAGAGGLLTVLAILGFFWAFKGARA